MCASQTYVQSTKTHLSNLSTRRFLANTIIKGRISFIEDRQFHNRIYRITFLFSILVIWVHSFNAELYLGTTEAAAHAGRLERILGEDLGQIAVPGFLMVSSYLLYRNFQWSLLAVKWRSHIQSILIPCLLWDFLYYVGYVAVTHIPAVHGLIGKPPIPFNLLNLLDALINCAYNPVFWCLYQLLILIVLAPVVCPVFRRTLTGGAALLLIAFALWKGWDFPHLNMDALFYFCIAAYISLHHTVWGAGAEAHPAYAGKLFAFLGSALLLLTFLSLPESSLHGRALAVVLYRVWDVAAAWSTLTVLLLPLAGEWMKHNFFLYVIHFAWVHLFNKAGALILPFHPASTLATYFFMPPMMAAINTLLIKVLTRFSPGLYRILSGNRQGESQKGQADAGRQRNPAVFLPPNLPVAKPSFLCYPKTTSAGIYLRRLWSAPRRGPLDACIGTCEGAVRPVLTRKEQRGKGESRENSG